MSKTKGWTRRSYDAIFRWSNPAERAAAEKVLLSDGLTDVIDRLHSVKNMGDWYRITQEAAASVPQSVIESSAKQAEVELNAAAAALGRKGGMSTSKAKTIASRANGALGGRPTKKQPNKTLATVPGNRPPGRFNLTLSIIEISTLIFPIIALSPSKANKKI